MRLFLRWRGTTPERAANGRHCMDCGIDLLLGDGDTPRVRITGGLNGTVVSEERMVITVDPLCWRCWRKHQKRDDELDLHPQNT